MGDDKNLDAPTPRDLSFFRDRVLLVEDDPSQQLVFGKLLKMLRFQGQLMIANDGVEAVDLFQRFSQEITLIFMDIHMPRMDGLKATQAIRDFERKKKRSFTPIVCTSSSAERRERDWRSAGLTGRIGKPFSLKQFPMAFDFFRKARFSLQRNPFRR